MALHWNVEAVQDYEAVCFYEAPADDPNRGVKKGDRVMNPVTNVLIMSTMSVGLPGITQANVGEFFARLRLLEQTIGPFLIRAEVDGERPTGEKAWITIDEVIAHIGITANVSPVTRAQWLKTIGRDLDANAQRAEERLNQLQTAQAMEAGAR